MIDLNDVWRKQRQRRWMCENAHRYIRADAYRFMVSGLPRYYGKDAVRYFWPYEGDGGRPECDGSYDRKYSVDQPRVPAGDPGGGQWMSGGSGIVRLASSERSSIGRAAISAIFTETAKRAIENYRKGEGLRDLFGRNDGAVAVTDIDGKQIFGSNSTSPTYNSADRAEADRLRSSYLKANGEPVSSTSNGLMPTNAFYHAETTTLTRAARASGGTLAGRTLDVYGDTRMCNNCDSVLPFVGLELGNPTVTFIEPGGKTKTMRDGAWINEGLR